MKSRLEIKAKMLMYTFFSELNCHFYSVVNMQFPVYLGA